MTAPKEVRILFIKESSNEFSYWQTEVSDFVGCRNQYEDFKDAEAFMSVADHDSQVQALKADLEALVNAYGNPEHPDTVAMEIAKKWGIEV